jgi:hypothetical protein
MILLTIITCGQLVATCTAEQALKAYPVPMQFTTIEDCLLAGQELLVQGLPGFSMKEGQLGAMVCDDHWVQVPRREET